MKTQLDIAIERYEKTPNLWNYNAMMKAAREDNN